MEATDSSIIEGLKREKDEEVGVNFQILLYPKFSMNFLFTKKDGNSMILPHYLSIHEKGEIDLNEEYSEFQWVELDKLEEFEPKIANIPHIINEMLRLEEIAEENEFVLI